MRILRSFLVDYQMGWMFLSAAGPPFDELTLVDLPINQSLPQVLSRLPSSRAWRTLAQTRPLKRRKFGGMARKQPRLWRRFPASPLAERIVQPTTVVVMSNRGGQTGKTTKEKERLLKDWRKEICQLHIFTTGAQARNQSHDNVRIDQQLCTSSSGICKSLVTRNEVLPSFLGRSVL